MSSTELIHRATLEELLGWRERALELANAAAESHRAFLAAVKEASEVATRAAPGSMAFYKLGDYVAEDRGQPERLAEKVRHDLDRCMWRHLLTVTGIEGLMDEQARKEFERDLASEPPEITPDNVRATFRQFKRDASAIFRRGLVNAFSGLDRAYRSHDGFKIGSRMVRSYALSDWGSVYDSIPALRDIDRVMFLLDGGKVREGWTSNLVAALDRKVEHSYSRGIQPGSVTTEYWHVKWFKNRNMHIYPLRKDLVRRANRLIAEHFEEALGAGPDAAGARRYQRAKPHHSQVEDFYPTPPAVVQAMVDAACLQRGMEVLEPSAGDGAIVAGLLDAGIHPDCVEIDPERAETLRDMLPPGCVMNLDFLKMHPEPAYDAVLMNPPFGQGSGVQHVFHALRFLKPGGRLVAVLGAGMEYREDGPTRELRSLIRAWGGTIRRLPAGSFIAAGTHVETVLVTVTSPSAAIAALPSPEPEVAALL